MKTDITYCTTKDCIHRRGCRRWTKLYTESQWAEALTIKPNISYMSGEECQASEPFPFGELVRFRNSDGSALSTPIKETK